MKTIVESKTMTIKDFVDWLKKKPQTATIDDFEVHYTTKYGHPCSYMSEKRYKNKNNN